ncbi:MAG TPA: hypothetical protein VGS22_11070 [Thermoanaerobaculia bacterium]|jgi:hypothetical protein|nr:hypothetical protein [Thermoanaerobaculia bacterium]
MGAAQVGDPHRLTRRLSRARLYAQFALDGSLGCARLDRRRFERSLRNPRTLHLAEWLASLFLSLSFSQTFGGRLCIDLGLDG